MSIDNDDVNGIEECTADPYQAAALERAKSLILWAREQKLILAEVHVGDVRVSLHDPMVNIPRMPLPGEHDDIADRGRDLPPSNFYEAHARTRTPGKRRT